MTGPLNGLHGAGNIADAFAHMPTVKQDGTPEQGFADHLSDHYGIQARNYKHDALHQHANHFAAQHGGGHDDVIKQLTELVASLRAEIAEMKHGKSGVSHESGRSRLDEATSRANDKAKLEKDNADAQYEKYVAAKLEMKIMKKARDDILEMWG